MTRVYDFSQLTRKLRTCTRAYTCPTKDGRFKVYVVQDEMMTPPDAEVYVAGDVNDARDAAIEVSGMITAARLLAS